MATFQKESTKRCPHCAEEILADAKKCKHCGEFLEAKAVVIEQTSKRYKKQMLVGVLSSILGVFVFLAAASMDSTSGVLIGVLMVLGGILVFIAARAGAWWYHG